MMDMAPVFQARHDGYDDFYNTAKVVTGLYFYPIVCIAGITGNLVTLFVYCQKKMATSTNVFLSALALADTIKLTNDLLYFVVIFLQEMHIEKPLGWKMHVYLYPCAHYIFNMSVCISAWLTVSVAVERFVYVCYPATAKEKCTIDRSRIVCLVVFLLMILLSLPSALRYVTVQRTDTSLNVTHLDIKESDFGKSNAYLIYLWVQNLLRSIVPLIILFCLNIRIIYTLRRTPIRGKLHRARSRITIMLLAVIIAFLIFVTPDAVLSTAFDLGYYDEGNLVRGIREITDLLLAVNSAVNFIFYCTMSHAFREMFLQSFCCRAKTNSTGENGTAHEVYCTGLKKYMQTSVEDEDANGHVAEDI